jgi:hypothetical protein
MVLGFRSGIRGRLIAVSCALNLGGQFLRQLSDRDNFGIEVFPGAGFAGLEQENAEIILGAGRSTARSGCGARISRLDYSGPARA